MRSSLRLTSSLLRQTAPRLTTTSTTLRSSLTTTRPITTSQQTAAHAAAQAQTSQTPSKMSSQDLSIESTNIKTAPGISLSSHQQTLVGSVLDLFAGRPSLAKLQLWTDDATFADPITNAQGRKQYEAQWYGLQTAFSEIERLGQEVTGAGNPITMTMKTRYKVKGVGSEKVIDSVINIFTTEDGGKIVKVEDKWDGKLPDGAIANVSSYLCPEGTVVFGGCTDCLDCRLSVA